MDRKRLTKPQKERPQGELVTRENILQTMRMVDPRLLPDSDVISFFQEMIEEYVEQSVEEMMIFAKHRGDNTVDFRDAKLFYERAFKHSIPGILSVIQQNHPPTESIVKSLNKKKPIPKSYLAHLQDFKKSKK
ncbi:hypothetical protein EIN_493110 [Entamoeba invadens IP1]|uniref:Transcription initiation factor TFIID subunit 12 domain-containing protein n=1 Tax=Entamoeba invadens IP1 TaxID=370355 RepID=A0A0A1U460_ENTIV|nr:hypothetical protein EIN_493110 [Entamoeba invadens IP1]ELP89012.1 hypothetical protein EIN_493110 [Entamoeba invadens IP1]|eukprot:XP_004255783.1 hypothetical protein EIN_493110 [Entamoeba invadens IP1]